MHKQLYIGVMTGTSADGIDVALSSLQDTQFQTIDSESIDFPQALKAEVKTLSSPCFNELFRAQSLGIKLSQISAILINEILARNKLTSVDVAAIGFHGQTIRHHPEANPPFSVQIGCPSTLAHETGIKTISDFRMADIAAGGQGAPLVPAFHEAVFYSPIESRLILNIGGIANLTLLPSNKEDAIFGFDTGPGNTLLDTWIHRHQQKDYDSNGDWARTGKLIPELLDRMLQDEYLIKEMPKSTGKEYFNLEWLETYIASSNYEANDIQRTLVEFTCASITQAIESISAAHEETPLSVYLCGGGINNSFLIERLTHQNPKLNIKSTQDIGIHPQLVEASAFAWLAHRTLSALPGNLKSVTGAHTDKVLGGLYLP